MPELPEVETVCRGLTPVMAQATFEMVKLNRRDLRFPLPDAFEARLEGENATRLYRRAKYLIADLASGESLVMHLGMSGRFLIEEFARREVGDFNSKLGSSGKHDHVIFLMRCSEGLSKVTYNDVRRFGFMDILPTKGLDNCKYFKGMGPEPLGGAFSASVLNSALEGKATPVKSALLDQRVVAGLGNIYVCEALYRAGISPRRKAASVSGARGDRLYKAIVDVLGEAIAAGGSSLKDFAATDGSLGYFQHNFDVYGREGEGCRSCGGKISRLVQSGRSTFYCGSCQR